jgi:AcrR family transcriptional regulator
MSLTVRQAQVVERLLVAAAEELETVGQEDLTIRSVALRAGVSPATAYTYLASKDHLLAELFCRLVSTAGLPELTGTDPGERLRETVRYLSELLATSPETTAAATKSLLGDDPQVHRLRVTIGALFFGWFRAALGAKADPAALQTISLAFFGALLEAGMGFLTYPELAARLDPVVTVIMKGTT